MYAFRAVAFALALALSGSAAFAAGEHGLEEVLIESATTPAQHQALADHFGVSDVMISKIRRGLAWTHVQ